MNVSDLFIIFKSEITMVLFVCFFIVSMISLFTDYNMFILKTFIFMSYNIIMNVYCVVIITYCISFTVIIHIVV